MINTKEDRRYAGDGVRDDAGRTLPSAGSRRKRTGDRFSVCWRLLYIIDEFPVIHTIDRLP